jgi:hypothetical protein
MSAGRGSKPELYTVLIILVPLALSFYAINGVKAQASPRIEWTQVSNPSTGGDAAWGVAVDSSGIYVVGYDVSPGDPEWRIEKRSLTDGKLLWSQTNNPSPNEDRAFGVAVDASGIYVVGFDSSPSVGDLEWRIEKRRLEDGSLLWSQVNNPSAGEDWAWAVAIDSSGIYVVGFDSSLDIINIQWRIEKVREEVAAPFYMQTWFIIVSMAVSVAIIFAVIISRRGKRKKRDDAGYVSTVLGVQLNPCLRSKKFVEN